MGSHCLYSKFIPPNSYVTQLIQLTTRHCVSCDHKKATVSILTEIKRSHVTGTSTSVYCCYQPLAVPKLQMKLCHRFACLCSKITWQSCVTSGLRDSPNVLEYIPCRQGDYKTQLNAQPAIHSTCATLVSTVHFLICKPLETYPTKHITKGYHSNLTSLVQNTASTNKE